MCEPGLLQHRIPLCPRMASVSRFSRFIPVYRGIMSFLSVITATAHSSVEHVAITEYSLKNPPSSTPMYITERARQPVGTWGEQHALPHGWSATVSTMSIFMSFGSQGAANWFDDFYRWLQVTSAAQTLEEGPYLPQIVAVHGGWKPCTLAPLCSISSGALCTTSPCICGVGYRMGTPEQEH